VIYFQYYDLLFDYGLRHTTDRQLVEDVIQDIFISLIKHRKSIGIVKSLKGYLISTFRRRLVLNLDKKKKTILTPTLPEEHFDYFKSPVDDESEIDKTERIYSTIRQSIAKLTDKQREIIYLRFEREISYEEILQIFVVREALEGLAARLSTPNIPAAEIERLYEKTKFYASEDQIDTDKLLALDVPLHSLILDYCGNETLQRFLKDMTDRINRVRMRSTVVTSRFHKSVEELLAIIEAIRARNPEQAEILMKEHIRHAKENTLTALSIPMPNLMMKE